MLWLGLSTFSRGEKIQLVISSDLFSFCLVFLPFPLLSSLPFSLCFDQFYYYHPSLTSSSLYFLYFIRCPLSLTFSFSFPFLNLNPSLISKEVIEEGKDGQRDRLKHSESKTGLCQEEEVAYSEESMMWNVKQNHFFFVSVCVILSFSRLDCFNFLGSESNGLCMKMDLVSVFQSTVFSLTLK